MVQPFCRQKLSCLAWGHEPAPGETPCPLLLRLLRGPCRRWFEQGLAGFLLLAAFGPSTGQVKAEVAIRVKPWARPGHGSGPHHIGRSARTEIVVDGLPGRGHFDSLVIETLNGRLEGQAEPFGVFQPPVNWSQTGPNRCEYESSDSASPLGFRGSFEAKGDAVDVTITVRNPGRRWVRGIWIWPCFELADWETDRVAHVPDPVFGDRTLERLFVVTSEGLTPMKRFGEPFWGADHFIQLGLLRQPIDIRRPMILYPAFLASSPDGRASVGMAWSDGLVFNSNVDRPCWHLTQHFGDLKGGSQRTVRGRYYFTLLPKVELWKRIQRDFPEWK